MPDDRDVDNLRPTPNPPSHPQGQLPATHSRRLPSLRTLVTLIVVLPIAAAAAALVAISIITSNSIAEQLGHELIDDATGRAASEVRRYIGDAVRVSDLYTRRIIKGELSTTQFAGWEPVMFDDLATNPNVASICFGNANGDATYLQRAHGRIELGISDGSRDCAAIEWPADLTGLVAREHPIRNYRYDPRVRPYYKTAVKNRKPAWTSVYFWFGDAGSASETGTGYTRPIYAPGSDGKLIGVLTIDVTLSAISEFLRRQDFSNQGAIFLLDDQDLLVAASEGGVNSTEGTRLGLRGSASPWAKAIAAAGIHAQRIEVNGQPARVNAEALRPYPGANWRIITVLPESEFLSQAKAMRQRSILLGCVAIAIAIAVGLVFSRRLSHPLLRLTEHASRIGSGDLRARLELGGARELQQLAAETNRMAAGLRERMELEKSLEIATHVQQSLLPRTVPNLIGLDIAAHSRYCDSTGGDYYDFIDIADLPQDRAFIAVGDVMGHGIGSALVMATARAAVRASAQSGELSLGQLMCRVNDVLASDPHGLFMTLALMVIEPTRGRVSYASAGHDPVIGYHPTTDRFMELEGGDIPLGIDVGHPFQDFSQNGLADGWVLFAGTDGVWEARNESNEMYGKERVREVLRANGANSAEAITAALIESHAAFIGKRAVVDDITFVVVKLIADAGATH